MKKKFIPTEEQKAAALERKTKIKALCKQIAAMPPETRAAIGAKLGIINPEGRELSVFNQCLLFSQLNTCSIVGGFKQWRDKGRQVMKGSRALCILGFFEPRRSLHHHAFMIPPVLISETETPFNLISETVEERRQREAKEQATQEKRQTQEAAAHSERNQLKLF